MKLKCQPENLENLCTKLEAQLGDAFLQFKNKNQKEGTVELVLNERASVHAQTAIKCSGFERIPDTPS